MPGTNLRIAHVTFTEEGIVIENLKKQRMLGVEKPLHISEFFSQLTDILMPYLDKSQKIGFVSLLPQKYNLIEMEKFLNFPKKSISQLSRKADF